MTWTSARRAPWLIIFALVLIHVRDAESQSSPGYGYGSYDDYGYDYGYGYGGGDNSTSWPPANQTTNGTANSTGSPPAICTMTPTWFPVGYENAASPAPLQYDSQLATGWRGLGDPLRVALSHTAPKFYLGANWFLSTEGEVPTECMGGLDNITTSCANTTATTSGAGRRLLALARRLLQLSGGDDEAATVLTPVTYAATWSLNQGPPTSLGMFKPGDNRGTPTIDMKGVYDDLPDGDYCVRANVTALQNSAVVNVNGVAHSLPCSNITQTTQFCFTKVVRPLYAQVKYSSCSSKFTVDFSGITPTPVSIFPSVAGATGNSGDYSDAGPYYGDYSPSQPSTYYSEYSDSYIYVPLYTVILHLYGNATRSSGAPDDLPLAESLDVKVEITDLEQTTASFTTDLQDGTYELHVRMMLVSSYPSLLDLPGTTYNDDGSATYLGVLLNGTTGDNVTIRHEQSDLSGLQCPAGEVVALPTERVFQWQHVGGGALNCFIDGVMKNNLDGGCVSPYSIALKDTRNHTIAVVLTDACGDSIIRNFTFNVYNCTADSDTLGFDTPPSPAPPPPPPYSSPYGSDYPPALDASPAYSRCSNIVPQWGPCGGMNGPSHDFSGPDAEWDGFCCDAASYCQRQEGNPWYWQCMPLPESPVAAPPVPEQPTLPPPGCVHNVPKWGTCGGKNGPKDDGAGSDAAWPGFCCAPGTSCQKQEGNAWYWQCL